MAESGIRAAVRQIARELGLPLYSQTGAWHSAGAPDFILCLNGRFVGVECKVPSGKLSRLQEREKARIEQHRGLYWIVHNADEFESLVQRQVERYG